MWPLMFLMILACDLGLGQPTPSSQGRSLPYVYSVHADRSTSTLLETPHPERPTLRDITYFHVVETAYPASEGGNAASKTGLTDTEDETETERAFTNAHVQGSGVIDDILPIALAEMEDDTDTENDDDDHDDVNTNQAVTASDDETTYIYYDDEDDTHDDSDDKTDAAKEHAQTPADEVEDDKEEGDEVLINFKGTASTTDENTVTEETIGVNDTAVIEEATTEKTSTQKDNFNRLQKLFSSPEMLRDRYLKMKNIIPTIKESLVSKERKKRSVLDTSELKDIPEAPKLEPINYDSLPKYIRAMISTEKPFVKEEVTEAIEKKIQTYETEHEKHRESIRKKMEQIFSNIKAKETEVNDEIKGLENQEDGIVNLKTDKVRTYGMNITNDHGVVWNNLWSNTGMYYNVGEQKVEEPVLVEENKEASSSQKPPYVNKPALFKPDEFSEIENNTKPDIVEPLLIDEDSNDIFVNINKDKVKDKPVPPSTDSRFDQNEDKETMKQDSIQEMPVDLKPLVEKKESIPESLNKLIEDDEFWDWITDWTAAYGEMLIEHVGNTIKEEIEKQMSNKTVSAAQKQSVDKDIESSTKKSAEKNEIGVTYDEMDTKYTTGERKIIFTDEGEVVLELTPETDDDDDQEALLKRRKNKDGNKPNDDNDDDKIVAQNIYGNAMGNAKVTNIFVFAPLNKTDMILEKLDLLTGSDRASNTNSVVIENRFSDTSDNKTENTVDDNKFSSGNQTTNDLTTNIEKEKNNDKDLSSKENSDKNQDKSDDTDTQDKTKVLNEHEKEIANLKEAHKKDIETLKSGYIKEIDTLKSVDQQKHKKTKNDKNIDAKSERVTIKINSEKSENTKETGKPDDKEIEKIKSDNEKEIEKLKSDHKKELEDFEKQYKDEIEKLKRELNKDSENSEKGNNKNITKSKSETENPKGEEKPVNDEIKEPKSNNKQSTEKKESESLEKDEKKDIDESGDKKVVEVLLKKN